MGKTFSMKVPPGIKFLPGVHLWKEHIVACLSLFYRTCWRKDKSIVKNHQPVPCLMIKQETKIFNKIF